jgi:hypothetical protein
MREEVLHCIQKPILNSHKLSRLSRKLLEHPHCQQKMLTLRCRCTDSTRGEESKPVACTAGLSRYANWPALDDATHHLSSQRDHPVPPSPSMAQVLTPTNDLHCYNQGLERPHQSSFASGDISNGVLETAPSATRSTLIRRPDTMIGKIYRTTRSDIYVFRCDHHECVKKTFSRWYEFRRHYNGSHARLPVVYWCEYEGCPRSEAVGDRPFPRKDKLKDHIESVHLSGNQAR